MAYVGEEWIDEWQSSIAERTARVKQLSARVAGVTASASTSDGAVEVTVSSSGAVTDLRLDEQVRRWPVEQLAAEIMTVIRQAQSRLASRVAQTVGEPTPTAMAVVEELEQRFPQDDWSATNRGGYGAR